MVFLHGPWITECFYLMWTSSHKTVKATDVLFERGRSSAKGESPRGYKRDVSILATENK